MSASISESGSVTAIRRHRTFTGNPITLPCAGGPISTRTMPEDEPLTSHLPAQPCTPHPSTRELSRLTERTEASGTVMEKAHPIRTRRSPPRISAKLPTRVRPNRPIATTAQRENLMGNLRGVPVSSGAIDENLVADIVGQSSALRNRARRPTLV